MIAKWAEHSISRGSYVINIKLDLLTINTPGQITRLNPTNGQGSADLRNDYGECLLVYAHNVILHHVMPYSLRK